MTVSYNLDVSSTSIVAFLKLQMRWRGSIWKSVVKELLLFSTAFVIITVIYRSNYILSEKQRLFWDDFAALFDQKMDYIPLTFMLGFFVTIIVGRWNDIFLNMGWVDNTALVLATYVRGSDEKTRMLRRNIVRYMVLTQVLVLRDLSMQVRRRYPSLETVVASGFMLKSELEIYDANTQRHSKYFLPIQWCFCLLFEARQSGKIAADLMLNEILKHITDFRKGLMQLSNFDWVPIPLVYPQVVFLAVRSYFFLCLISRQSVLIDGEKPKDDNPAFLFVPFFMTSLQFIFYVGWMKVAESLMNPLGEDDDDFECNFLVDRNLSVGFSMVDDNYNEAPLQTEKDDFWNKNCDLLYSEDSAERPVNPQIGSAAGYEPAEDTVMMVPHMSAIDDQDYEYTDDPEGAPLLRRGISVISVNRQCGSRTSLASKKTGGVMDSIKKQFSRDGRKLSRPNRLNSQNTSQFSLNQEGRPAIEIIGESSLDILGDLADEANRNSSFLTPDGWSEQQRDLSPTSPTRRPSPVNEVLTSVPEEDEETQRTMRQADLRKLQKEHKENEENGTD